MLEQIGNYRITEEIGYGGMAVVYKGIQESLGRTVAIKALRTSMATEKDAVARFEREATSMASFQHENIITIYDFFPHRGALFIVMEYVEGQDLYDLLEQSPRLPPDIVVIIALQVARALDYAHFRGVIHRDVKPANIILSKLGTVKLTDFGIARLGGSDLTWTGVGLGTPAYMSPEQVTGQRLDGRSDIFSLGVAMYQMATGQKPFEEDTQLSVLQKVRTLAPPAPRSLNPGLPRELERIISRCMAKSPRDRYGSTQELMGVLELYLAEHVNLNYRARLLLFLQQEGVLSEKELKATMNPALLGSPMSSGRKRRRFEVGPVLVLLSGVWMLVSVVLLALFALRPVGLGVNDAAVSRQKTSSSVHASAAGGKLRIVAVPWAKVEVDGEVRAITPLDRALRLPPGKHTVRLLNPHYQTSRHEVTVKGGEQVELKVKLKPRPAIEATP